MEYIQDRRVNIVTDSVSQEFVLEGDGSRITFSQTSLGTNLTFDLAFKGKDNTLKQIHDYINSVGIENVKRIDVSVDQYGYECEISNKSLVTYMIKETPVRNEGETIGMVLYANLTIFTTSGEE